jgi:hypothetical protein
VFEREQTQQFSVSGPGIAVPLTALIKPPLMYPSHVIEELVQAGAIAIHSVIVVPTTKLGIQQLHLFSDTTMAVLPAPLSYAFQ